MESTTNRSIPCTRTGIHVFSRYSACSGSTPGPRASARAGCSRQLGIRLRRPRSPRRAPADQVLVSEHATAGAGSAAPGLRRTEDVALAARARGRIRESSKPSDVAATRRAAPGPPCPRRRLGDQQAQPGAAAPADPAAQLVQLRDAEAVGVQHDHHGGVRHVHADLDHGGGDQHVDASAGGEPGHHVVLLGGRQAARAARAEPQPRAADPAARSARAPLHRGAGARPRCRHRRRRLAVGLAGSGVDPRAHHVRLVAGGDLLAQPLPRPGRGRRACSGAGTTWVVRPGAAGGQLGEGATPPGRRRPSSRPCAGSGWRSSPARAGGRSPALAAQRVPLLHAEPVLLVDDHQAEVGELHALVEQGVGARPRCRPRRRPPRAAPPARAAAPSEPVTSATRVASAVAAEHPRLRQRPEQVRRCSARAGRPAPRSGRAAPPGRRRRRPAAWRAARPPSCPSPTSPCSRRCIGWVSEQVARQHPAPTSRWPPVSVNGRRASNGVEQPARWRPAGPAAGAAARRRRWASDHLERRRPRPTAAARWPGAPRPAVDRAVDSAQRGRPRSSSPRAGAGRHPGRVGHVCRARSGPAPSARSGDLPARHRSRWRGRPGSAGPRSPRQPRPSASSSTNSQLRVSSWRSPLNTPTVPANRPNRPTRNCCSQPPLLEEGEGEGARCRR